MKAFPLPVLLLLPLLLSAADNQTFFKARLRFEKNEGLSITDSAILLPAKQKQTGNAPLKIEAENPFALDFQNNQRKIAIDEETQLRYISWVKMVTYQIYIEKPGKYTVWYRANFPLAAGYNHLEKMDDGESISVLDSEISEKSYLPPNVWHWTKRHQFNLSAGWHTYHFPKPSAYNAGAKLDCIVLVPEWMETISNQALEQAAAQRERTPEGWAETRRIKTENMQNWFLNFIPENSGGEILLTFAYDKRDYRQVEPGKVYTPPSGASYLYFKIHMKQKPDAAISPVIYDLRLMIKKKQHRNEE